MTQPGSNISPILSLIQNLDLAVPTRQSYFEHVPFIDQTLAKAEDVNQLQRNIELGLDHFGEDVTYSLDQMRMGLTAFANMILARQSAYEIATDAKVQAFIDKVDQEISTWKAYADKGDADTLMEAVRQSRVYTDAEIKVARSIALQQAWKATHIEHRAYAAGVNDGGNYFGGKPWGIPIVDVPGDHYFLITFYSFQSLDLGDIGGAADELSISWTPFFGLKQNPGAQTISAVSAWDQPGWVLSPGENSAYIFINNLKLSAQFKLHGYWVPNFLITAAAKDPLFPREWMGPLAFQYPAPTEG